MAGITRIQNLTKNHALRGLRQRGEGMEIGNGLIIPAIRVPSEATSANQRSQLRFLGSIDLRSP
jgi:hypothetical protein